MQYLIKILIVVALITMVGCATAPEIQKPLASPLSSEISVFRSPILDQTNHTVQYLNKDKDILYYQTYGGGGAGLGLLAGPFGVVANIKMIESATMKDVTVLNEKLGVSISDLFGKAAEANDYVMSASDSTSGIRINPYLLVEKTEGEQLMLASVLLVDTSAKFPNKYVVQLPVQYGVEQLSSLSEDERANLERLVVDGFASLLNRLKAETTVDVALEKKIKVKSEFLSPRFNFEMPASLIEIEGDLVWVRMIGSVAGVYQQHITYKE
jgi:hypothetical protein